MHLPLNGLVLGEAAGEGDFGAVLIDSEAPHDLKDEEDDEGEEEANDRDAEMRKLRFTRTKRGSMSVTEKRAWVVSPGMGHIGYVKSHRRPRARANHNQRPILYPMITMPWY